LIRVQHNDRGRKEVATARGSWATKPRTQNGEGIPAILKGVTNPWTAGLTISAKEGVLAKKGADNKEKAKRKAVLSFNGQRRKAGTSAPGKKGLPSGLAVVFFPISKNGVISTTRGPWPRRGMETAGGRSTRSRTQ